MSRQNRRQGFRFSSCISHLEREHLNTVCLSAKNHVLKRITVYIGSINSSAVRIGEVFKEALKHNSAAFTIAPNHLARRAPAIPRPPRL